VNEVESVYYILCLIARQVQFCFNTLVHYCTRSVLSHPHPCRFFLGAIVTSAAGSTRKGGGLMACRYPDMLSIALLRHKSPGGVEADRGQKQT